MSGLDIGQRGGGVRAELAARLQTEQTEHPCRIRFQRQIRRPEIVSPLRDAVRLVDHDEVDGIAAKRADEVGIARQPFGRGQHELGIAAADCVE